MSKKDMDGGIGQGIFDMEFINDVNAIKDIIAAKKAAYDKIDASKATDENKRKAMCDTMMGKLKEKALTDSMDTALVHGAETRRSRKRSRYDENDFPKLSVGGH